MYNNSDILCPVCLSKLIVTYQARYEGIEDRIGNYEPSLKDGYVCMNVDWCCAANINCSWTSDGDLFMSYGTDQGLLRKKFKESYKKYSKGFAINSWNYYYNVGKEKIKEKTKKICIGKYRFNFIPNSYGYKYPDNKQYLPKRFSYKIEIWKKTDEMSYTQIIPDIRMIRYLLGNFNRAYRNDFNLSEALCIAKGLDSYTLVSDNRRYVKLTSLIIKVLYFWKYQRLMYKIKNKELSY
jgi:hypothetical protein